LRLRQSRLQIDRRSNPLAIEMEGLRPGAAHSRLCAFA